MGDYTELLNYLPSSVTKDITKNVTKNITKNMTTDVIDTVKNKLTDLVTGSGVPPVQPVTSTNPIVQDVFGTLDNLNKIKYVITVFLVFWGVLLIVYNYLPNFTDKEKEELKYIHTVLFGNLGILPMILILWVLLITVTVILPSLINLTPRFSTLLSSFNDLILSFVKK
jgi:hypothetical protein